MSRQLPTYLMQPTEIRTLRFDFANKLALQAGDAITGTPTVVVTPAGLTSPVQTVDGNTVLVRLEGGSNGADYEVDVAMGTVLGDLLHLSATIQVRVGAN